MVAGEREIPLNVLMRYFRVPVGPLPVDYSGRALLLGSSITNVSANGVFVRTLEPLSYGTELEIAFRLPNEKEQIRGVAVVRWVKTPADVGEEAAGMGLEFVRLSRKGQKQLERFVRAFLTRMRGRLA